MIDLSKLSIEDRTAWMLMLEYENVRRKYQSGYRVVPLLNEKVLNNPIFKQFRTVAKWLTELGFDIRWLEVAWKGYLEFCFNAFKPKMPQPGQLKNAVLLKKYLSLSYIERNEVSIDEDVLKRLYKRVLDPSIADDTKIHHLLGVT